MASPENGNLIVTTQAERSRARSRVRRCTTPLHCVAHYKRAARI